MVARQSTGPQRNQQSLKRGKRGVLFQTMLNAGTLTFKEFAMREPLPLATIHDAVLEFLRGRDDAVVFGAQAVNAYVDEPRMSQDIDLVSTHAAELAEELRDYLSERFYIAVRVPVIGADKGYRLFQIQKPRNRHLVDVRTAESLPHAERIEDVLVMSPPELIAHKVIAYHARRGQPKAGTTRPRPAPFCLLCDSHSARECPP